MVSRILVYTPLVPRWFPVGNIPVDTRKVEGMRISSFGAVEKRASGRWRARYVHPTRPYKEDGARNYIAAPTTFATKTAARDWLSGIQSDIARGAWKSPEQVEAERLEAERAAALAARTFGSYAEGWMESRPLTPATRRAYQSSLRTHLLPQWGNTPLQAITTPAVREWLANLAPGRPGARKKSFELFKTILNTAVDDDILAANPCKRNMLGTVSAAPAPSDTTPTRKQERRALTLSQLEALAAEVPPYMRVLVLLTGLTGPRSGEVRNLHGRHITTDTAGLVWLNIQEAVSGQGAALAVGTPKTAKSIRSIPVPSSLTDDVLALADKAGPDGLLFHPVSDSSRVIPERTFQINLKRAGERAGIGHVSPHDLRHTAVSLARDNGAPDTAVRDLVGHTTTSMTSRYTHTTPETLARVVDAVDRERTRPAAVASLDQRRRQA